MTSDLPRGRVAVPAEVVRRAFGDETVLLNLQTSHYHGLNATAAHMLDLLEETGDAQETVRRVAFEADVPEEIVAADLAELCVQLLERGLITLEDG